ncbi:gluconolactonase [Naegleria gruberi]|uniref:Gluconolactonase n=1 Tax=Naegleria gruberi TaxID=5762 RepID=D2V259_NAEGR|nr:gluconolactonase [Naegleria gruberi]EFC48847.1 gluconolactonase [Naegleria gruberi]|eukprot:XP_002681591.1 gluconolactonase [Naegleria gruberi strain NEG-M]
MQNPPLYNFTPKNSFSNNMMRKSSKILGINLLNFVFIVLVAFVMSTNKLRVNGSPTQQEYTSSPVELVHAFNFVNFNFTSEEQRQEYMKDEIYKLVALAGVKVDANGDIYVSMPRWKSPKIPATLAKIVKGENGQPILEPFPSWEWNNVNNATFGLQSVLGFEIDGQQRMWILDQGKVAGKAAEKESIKLVVWDLEKNELIAKYHFTPEEASPTNSFLNDIVVDSDQNIAFISDSGIPIDNPNKDPTIRPQPGILVIDIDDLKVKRWFDGLPQVQVDQSAWLDVNGKKCLQNEPMKTGVDGIALSCDYNRLYWTPLTSRTLYGIDANLLLMYPPNTTLVHDKIVNYGDKISSSDGFAISSDSTFYITAIENNTIYEVSEEGLADVLEGKTKISDFKLREYMVDSLKNITITHQNELVWPDTIGISNDGYMYFVTNNLCDYVQGFITDFDKPNFFIHRKFIGASSYVNGCEQAHLELGAKEWATIGTLLGLWILGLVIIVVSVTIVNRRKKAKETYTTLQ